MVMLDRFAWNGETFEGLSEIAFAIDGPMNGDVFFAHVEQILVPTLTPSDIVVMDNLSVQGARNTRATIPRS
jgi:hypothetical protein